MLYFIVIFAMLNSSLYCLIANQKGSYMTNINISKCQELRFSYNLMTERINKARLIFGDKILKNILCFSLYILGAQRNNIAEALYFPENTVRSMLRRIFKVGFQGFTDRREKTVRIENIPVSLANDQKKDIEIKEQGGNYKVNINGCGVLISKNNPLQFKTLLLLFAENRLMSKVQVGKYLNISPSHVGLLCKNVSEKDIYSLIDKRQGQQKDYVFTPEKKSELIIQYAANAAEGKSTSSSTLAKDLEQRTSLKLSDRSIRHHINILGLKGKAGQLWALTGLKKTPHNSTDCYVGKEI